MPVTVFRSSDAGTNKTGYAGLKGAAGDLIKVLNSTLVLDTGFTLTGASTYADQTAAWVQMGAGAAAFLNNTLGAGGIVPDMCYLGGRQKFSQIVAQLATLGTGAGAFAIEYWNGSAWTAVVSPTDGTAALTAAGTISWSASAQTGWAQVAVNSVTLYWVRLRLTTVYTIAPVAKLLSVYGWGSPYQGTSGATYRSMLTTGVQHYVTVNDNAPNGTSLGREAWAYAAEALTQYNADQFAGGTNGVTGPFPSMTQGVSSTTGHVVIRKSADTTTVRTWKVLMDEKTFYFFAISGDATVQYIGFGFGEFYSLMSGDLYRSFIAGRLTENSSTIIGSGAGLTPMMVRHSTFTYVTTATSVYVPRGYLGIGSSLLVTTHHGFPIPVTPSGYASLPTVSTFNGPDNGVLIAPISFMEMGFSNALIHLRGRLRGLWDWGHLPAAALDGDTFLGTGVLSTKSFEELKTISVGDFNGNYVAGVIVLETSNTWETN